MLNMQGKTFLYLIQGEGLDIPYMNTLPNKNSDIIYLSWKAKNDKMIYFPDSTWTEGRNRLLEEALNLKHKYEFYIFMDDDLVFQKGGFAEFEELLLKYRPAIATPCLLGYQVYENLALDAHTVFKFDAAMNAFHHSVVFDNVIFPYNSKFDSYSWWYSQYILIILANIFYRGAILQINDVLVVNEKHRPYLRTMFLTPWEKISHFLRFLLRKESKINYFMNVDKWLYTKRLSNHPDVVATMGQFDNFTDIQKPKEPKASYKVMPETKALYFQ